jgi:glycine betaine/choline ABC-type transport system substrate-binding protein
LLEALGARLTKNELCNMNYRIDVERRSVVEVAHRFLEEQELLG